jgi:FKBP-type peptidyl-prolyl cis-trans isomerase
MTNTRIFPIGALISVAALSIMAGCTERPPEGTAEAGPNSGAPQAITGEREQYSYAIGTRLGANLIEQGLEVDQESFLLAMRDALSSTPPRLSEEAMMAALTQHQEQAQQQMQQEADANLTRSKEYLDRNREASGIVQTDSGLQYKVLQAGTGAAVRSGDEVTVHYTGTLISGEEFDSSRKRGEPVTFATGNVIPGWQEALVLMHGGDHWQVFIPPDLAYGEQGAGGTIGPNEALIFDIELLEIHPADATE